ncbi:site-specific recombinase XerD [Opitutaceae bacterium TAV1]|nr:site-specific recombinase XerD [Opitutaceae bacterium TAV1]
MNPETLGNSKPKTWEPVEPNFYRNLKSGIYYSRFGLNGPRTFKSLKTSVLTVARLRHKKKMADIEKARQSGITLSKDIRTLGDIARIFGERLKASTEQDDSTKTNYLNWLKRLQDALPNFDRVLPGSLTFNTLLDLRNRLAIDYSPASVNQTLSLLRTLLRIAREFHLVTDDPFVAPDGAVQKSIWSPKKTRKPMLPSKHDMARIFDEMEKPQGGSRIALLTAQAKAAAEHARFLAYSGARLEEGNAACMEDWRGDTIHLHGTKSESSDRVIPVTRELRALLTRIKKTRPTGPVLTVRTSRGALERACERLGLPRLRHHDLRHYFATVCIESGVDIPTVSRWLGHSDGGTLAMKTYGHLRDEHSLQAIRKVSFSDEPAAGSTPA